MAVPEDKILGAYRLVERIGRGGMGEVYRAQHLKLGREAAVKVLPPALANEADFLKRFEREAASAAALDHPNILPVWDYGEQGGVPYLVMPLIKDGALKERLERNALPLPEATRYLGQMAEALDYAHEQGIVHRDVKPANMLLGSRGRLYLADFGIAKALEGSEGLTRTGLGVGTPEYMAPEQAQGRADGRSDLYALGVVLYQMLTGRVPFSGSSAVEVLIKHLQEPLPTLPLRGVPPGVERIIQRVLAKNPDERYQTGRALVEALNEALAAGRGGADATLVVGVGGDGLPTPVGNTPPPPGWQPPAQQPGGQTPPPSRTPPGNQTPPPLWTPAGGQTPPPSWTPPGGQTPPPVWTPPGGPTPPSHATGQAGASAGTAAGGRPLSKPLLIGGIIGLLALSLLCVGGLAALLRGQSSGTTARGTATTGAATATAQRVAGTSGSGTAVAVAARASAAPIAPTGPAPAVNYPYPSGGRYSTLEQVGRRGGQITELVYGEAQTFNPMISNDTPSSLREAMLFNALVGANPDNGLPFPDLAEEVPALANGGISRDGLTYTFKLRKDVKWHDGRSFTAKDVVFTYTTMANKDLGSPRTGELNERVESVTAPNDFTVVFKLKGAVAPFLTSEMFAIVPEHILGGVPVGEIKAHPFSTGDARQTIGTGPFRFGEWVRGDRLTLVKNPNYFRGEPALDGYVFKVFKDANDLAQLKAGGFDYSPVTGELYGELSGQPNLTALTYDSYSFNFYVYQLDPAKTTLFGDKQVRQALAYALDREALVKEFSSGFATVAPGTMPVPSWAYAPEQMKTRYTYDPNRANQLLDAAGWRRGPNGIRAKDGQQLAFTLWTETGNEAFVGKMQEQWRAIGVEATPRTEDFGAFLRRITETHDFEMFVSGFTVGIDPDQTGLWATASYQGAFNFGRYSNRQVDDLLVKGSSELDQEKRRQLYIEMQNILMDELPSMILNFEQVTTVVNKRVHNLKPNAINVRWNAHLWWVEDGR